VICDHPLRREHATSPLHDVFFLGAIRSARVFYVRAIAE
jgi:hypothetical protein